MHIDDDEDVQNESALLKAVRRIAEDPPWWWVDVYRDLDGRSFPLDADVD